MQTYFNAMWSRFILLVAAGVFTMLPTMIKGIPSGDDLNHHYRVGVSMYESIRHGDVHPGWNYLSTDGYGDVTCRFYPPMFYYLMSFARLVTGDWYSASVFIFVVLSIVGGLGTYCWARTFLKPNVALCGGLFFIFSPFFVAELYQFSMFPQFAACAILPFAFAFLELVCRRLKRRYVIGLAIAYAMLVLTHLPSAVIGSIALAIYGLFRIRRSDYLKSFGRLILAVLLGLGSSAFYWVTMISESAWRRGNKGEAGVWYDYHYNFIFGNTVDSTTVWWATRLAFGTLLMAVPAVVLLRKPPGAGGENTPAILAATHPSSARLRTDDRPSWLVNMNDIECAPFKALAVITVISFFMMIPLSRPIWDVLPFLKEVQLPWRWLTIASMSCAILGAASLPGLVDLAKTRLRPVAMLGASCLLIAFSFTFLQVIRGANFLSHSTFDTLIETVVSSPSLPDWRPIWASKQPKEMTEQVEASGRQIDVTSWQREHRTFQIGAGPAEEARVKTYYYPHWLATANGKHLETRPAEDGALLIALPSEAIAIDLTFTEPPYVRASNIVSVLAWGMIAGFIVIFVVKNSLLKSDRRLERAEVRDLRVR